MPGPTTCLWPRDLRRGAVLTLAVLGVLGTGAAAGWWDGEERPATVVYGPVRPAGQQMTADRGEVARAAAEALADGKSAKEAAEDVVSRSGDRWGVVYDTAEYAEFEETLDGRYTGVGLWAQTPGGADVRVSRVAPQSPAARAGIKVGDRILGIDGRQARGLDVPRVVELLRGGTTPGVTGRPGSAVRIELQRGERTWTETLRRARLDQETVTARRLPGAITLIRVSAFTKGSGELVRRAVRAAPAGDGLLLDLRGNRGGLVDEAVTAASAFLDGGLVATYDIRGDQRALYAERGGDTDRPLVALVDGGTMSAAELVTGALQDRGRAVTVGSRTFGKGSVQMPTRLADGSVAELTVGHYRTPAGREVDGEGVNPDLAVEDGALDRARSVLTGLGVGS
ncbi:S41 family peptidase [Streptomyces sp. NPDC006879]|uniref:S41 family peptidase n=1 Tax=Streptomyces sp. NPDC006879 TaxID=3364767 RepID=UPI0036BEEEB3